MRRRGLGHGRPAARLYMPSCREEKAGFEAPPPYPYPGRLRGSRTPAYMQTQGVVAFSLPAEK